MAPIAGPSADLQGRLEVWAPLLKGGKTDDLVRQLTELGATSIVCFEATRSVARLAPAKVAGRVARWETIAQEATRQCGRVEVPTVAHCPQLPDDGPGVYLWEDGGASASEVLGGWGTVPLRILVGPEGGLDTVDAAALDAAGWTPASLGPRVLRAETAVVAAASASAAALSGTERSWPLCWSAASSVAVRNTAPRRSHRSKW